MTPHLPKTSRPRQRVGGQAQNRAAELRRAFDEAFAAPPRQETVELEELLAVRVAGDPFALRVREIAGLEVERRIVSLPSRIPGFLGLAGIRGEIVPVYSLAVQLGYPAEREAPRWLVLCGTGERLGLALGEFEGYLKVSRADLHAARGGNGGREHVREMVRGAGTPRGLVSVESVVETIKRRVGAAGSAKER